MIWASAVATIVLAIATITLAFFNYRHVKATQQMVKEMKAAREMQATPSIIAYFDNPAGILIDLVVKNIGYGVAKDVRLKIDPPLLDHLDRDIAGLSLFRRGIDFFPLNREFRQIVGSFKQFFGDDSHRPLEYKLTVSYCDAEGNPFQQIIPLDLSAYRDLPIHRKSDVAEQLEELRKVIEKKS